MRTNHVLVIEPAASWRRLQHANEFFLQALDAQMKDNHRQFLEGLMRYERQCFLNAQPYERAAGRVNQANGFYERYQRFHYTFADVFADTVRASVRDHTKKPADGNQTILPSA